MAFCKSCGTEIGEAKFCPACGSAQDVTPVAPFQETVSAPVYSEPVSAPVFTPAPSAYSSTGDTSGTSSTEIPPVYTAPVYSAGSFEKPNTTGSMVFSIINIALGVLLCCSGVSLISTVLGIIALVFTTQAGKAATMEEARQKLKTAKIMNIIGVAFLALAVIITVIVVAVNGTGTWTDIMNQYGYSY